ncbi:hypothetical protein [Methylomonas koyamae]|uniref:Uncharacterized protein n=1 Tax=Methylomonas koyamae TaxID=702114 RepID=A0A291IMQ1_9GAMM|nr:hypothetical protein [Methylomonas koyamae]ATG91447.1 hypothetical protein MKLM6_3255 [Methylomonas koyamae]OAI26839.1 hypothetical protein A1356_10505 [Methylomonas koyamae]
MGLTLPFPFYGFADYCNELKALGVDPGYVMYTDRHANNGQPSARLVPAEHLPAALAYIEAPSDATFIDLVQAGVLVDTEWERHTTGWLVVSFTGWEVLHKAFSRLNAKLDHAVLDMAG